jgi:hypothetical protein
MWCRLVPGELSHLVEKTIPRVAGLCHGHCPRRFFCLEARSSIFGRPTAMWLWRPSGATWLRDAPPLEQAYATQAPIAPAPPVRGVTPWGRRKRAAGMGARAPCYLARPLKIIFAPVFVWRFALHLIKAAKPLASLALPRDSNSCFRRERARATVGIRHAILRID